MSGSGPELQQPEEAPAASALAASAQAHVQAAAALIQEAEDCAQEIEAVVSHMAGQGAGDGE